MILSRRRVLQIGGLGLAGLLPRPVSAANGDVAEIEMLGNNDGSKVWFAPVGLLARPGQEIRWISRDAGNVHTSTAYHPVNDDHPLRLPDGAIPWNSDYLLPDQTFSVVLTLPGVYDYFCIPHEHAGMVGRIVVAAPSETLAEPDYGSPPAGGEAAFFPAVEEILQRGSVFRT